ncbi:MAG: phosphomannomutase [Desulfobulbaceae bacterium]|nr:phosphomannomutase [Desulfobulbaceae bacterium]
MKKASACFKAYDIRGRLPDELNPELAEKIARAFAAICGVKKVVVGHDIRLSSPDLAEAVITGLRRVGVEVVFLGLCATEEVYHATFHLQNQGVDGGVMVTASHNPADYNGMKFVIAGAAPLSGDRLHEMAGLIASDDLLKDQITPGVRADYPDKSAYIQHLLAYVEPARLKPLKIVVNAGNGCAGPILDLLGERLPFSFIHLNHQPDGRFPKGVPNPLLPENRAETAQAVRESGADLGLAWDGDADRCFFWDERGEFVEGYYMVGLLAVEMLRLSPGATILYDPRLTWNTEELVARAGGKAVASKTGHVFIKEKMREERAVYGGEMSAHHYFRDFGFCDSGMISWLLVAALLSRGEAPLSQLLGERMRAYPVSGEINRTVADADAVLAACRERYADGRQEFLDGLSVSYPTWRFNVRKSNTEPLLRLNIETRGDARLLRDKTEELLSFIK